MALSAIAFLDYLYNTFDGSISTSGVSAMKIGADSFQQTKGRTFGGSKTTEPETVCDHVWTELDENESKKYGTIVAKCLSRWRECRKCDKVKFVGGESQLGDAKPWE